MADDQPTQIQPTIPRPVGNGATGLATREPAPSTGGPVTPPPPTPPVGTGGPGGFEPGDDPGDDRPRRTLLVGIGVALIVILGLLAYGLAGNDDGGKTTPAPVTTPTTTAGSTTPDAAQSTTPTAGAAPAPTTTKTPATTPASGSTGGVAAGDQATTPAADAGPLLTEGSVTKIKVNQGDTVRFRVRVKTANELHIHGYDKTIELPAGETVPVEFKATITGIYEMELHEGTAEQLGELTVEP